MTDELCEKEGLAKTKASNLKPYGSEEGPSPDYMYKKYGSWETVLLKAFSTNHGMDACLGLYDDKYPNYVALVEMLNTGYARKTTEYPKQLTRQENIPYKMTKYKKKVLKAGRKVYEEI